MTLEGLVQLEGYLVAVYTTTETSEIRDELHQSVTMRWLIHDDQPPTLIDECWSRLPPHPQHAAAIDPQSCARAVLRHVRATVPSSQRAGV